ncbi:hypothetical protein PF66_03355 [Pseudomonas asplenii]|uniref:Uncharacterized protein n=1 Tax=Pseudomonas asplenii TaxID=53407 RepID=A0A0M9GFV4_9PSED|nr:hypothetical protein PF66_03355 [Pseudomonas fuscovaginae]
MAGIRPQWTHEEAIPERGGRQERCSRAGWAGLVDA